MTLGVCINLVPLYDDRDFKIGHYGRLGRLDRCHVTQNTRDLLPSSFWDGCVFAGFLVVKTTVKRIRVHAYLLSLLLPANGLNMRWLVFI